MTDARSYAFLILAAALAGGCGAKTGLALPDAAMDAGTDAGPDASVPCIEVPPDGGLIEIPLETETRLGRADVLFLIDTTASMQDEIDQIRDKLRDSISAAIDNEIPDAQLAVATFADFPVPPYGDAEDRAFTMMLPMTDELSRVQAAVNSIELANGRDEPESQVEALFQVATGDGLGPWVPASFGCPMGGRGYPCFRDDALPIVLLFTDAPFHNGPPSAGGAPTNAYMAGDILPPPHTYSEAVEALSRLGVRVIGFDSGDGGGAPHLRQLATDTGALDEGGAPLVYDIGRRGEGLGTGVVDAMKTFADAVVFDVDAIVQDPVPGDGVDVTEFVDAIVPVRAIPMDGIDSIDIEASAFRGVRSGTTVVFQLLIRNDAIVPGPTARRFQLEIIFRGDGRTRLGRRIVEIVIPGLDGEGCEEDSGL